MRKGQKKKREAQQVFVKSKEQKRIREQHNKFF